jgi:hypothetical protein
MANRICQFSKNRTDIKIIKFGPQSEFCKSLCFFLIQLRELWRGLTRSFKLDGALDKEIEEEKK